LCAWLLNRSECLSICSCSSMGFECVDVGRTLNETIMLCINQTERLNINTIRFGALRFYTRGYLSLFH